MIENINLNTDKSKEQFPNVNIEIAKYLNQIDFMKLRNMFSEKITDLGLNPEKYLEKFVDKRENFKKSNFAQSIFTKGSYHKGEIYLTKDSFENLNKSIFFLKSDEREEYKFDYVLLLVSHEQTHAVSFDHEEDNSENTNNLIDIKGQSGYASTRLKTKFIFPSIEINHRIFNEAVTELIAREIFFDYTQRKLSDFELGYLTEGTLKDVISVFRYVCNKISTECGIEEEVLWKVIKHGYFAGEDLTGDKMTRLFNNIFPKDFEQKLKKGSALLLDKDIEDIKGSIDKSTWTDDDRKHIRRWILAIYNKMPESHK